MTEHSIPKETNIDWQKKQESNSNPDDIKEFLLKYNEKIRVEKQREQR